MFVLVQVSITPYRLREAATVDYVLDDGGGSDDDDDDSVQLISSDIHALTQQPTGQLHNQQ
jgi:hypothetical protein